MMIPFNEILEFWFEGISDETLIQKDNNPFRKWFLSSKSFDLDAKARFEKYFPNTDLNYVPPSPQEQLALIILYDQLSRNIYRNMPQAFQYDQQACLLADDMIKKGKDLELMFIERLFVYMPLMHAENIRMQEISVRCFKDLSDAVKKKNPENYPYYENNLKHALRYKQIIEAYSRFPHRDKILGRTANE
ncbi:MAG: DUF924 domain-containing protein [Candidatus Omnitrophica bacterium]|nr:DUF924 domain-containing protein [Candidatus Omnitrophota bacterium]